MSFAALLSASSLQTRLSLGIGIAQVKALRDRLPGLSLNDIFAALLTMCGEQIIISCIPHFHPSVRI